MKQPLADALAHRGYDALTPVQEAVSDPELAGRDLLVSAQTGSGKTVGFGLAIAPTVLGDADQLERASAPLALIIAPTRELALQVKREFAWLYARAGSVVASCVGGMDMRDERRALERGAHFVVATPGRLRDHIMRGSIDLSAIRAVVLDEADEMLDLGFREDLEFILGEAPDDRQTLLFSATVPKDIATLAKSYQRDALRIQTTSTTTQHADISYRAMQVSPRDGENAIINVLRYYEAPNAIVFANTRAMVNRLTTRLSNRGFPVVALSGELSQAERTHALQAMRDGRARVCVATDVAARGIDLPNLDLVIHAELPNSHETLLHRSGRTGRAGRKGVSALIVPPKFTRKAERLLKSAKLTPEWCEAPSADAVNQRDEERMMADSVWSDAITEGETATVARLLESFAPEQIAAAYLRFYKTRHSAPEELSPANQERNKPRPKAEFGESVWFSIEGGRDAGAEPRRILPMLCKAGGLSKDDIGAIRVRQDLSYVQILKTSVDGFLAQVGAGMTVENNAKLTRLDKAPDLPDDRGPRGGGKPKPRQFTGSRDKPPHRKSSNSGSSDGPREKRSHKPETTRPDGVVSAAKPRNKSGSKPKGPPPPKGKANSKKNKARAASAGKGGGGAPKRRKP
ncbi:DEAD/DEAH box helicase [Shimia thalassica]|uniref:DEAD/DEAH box helicase n=1 Tax=Shimia thalassica TaxID=1715693 RepID=UPI0027346FF2|nr:DEAD/DEAH box helicase [Shimia thalassica]MDP2493313.1 DEAD/DEAH box helicase [Shimia thalassica]